MSVYYNHFKIGNRSLACNVIIFSMGSFSDCPVRAKKQCAIITHGFKCYTEKSEKLWPKVFPYRKNQSIYWNENPALKIFQDMAKILNKTSFGVEYFRYNESSDFSCQDDVKKLSEIAYLLGKNFKILTYGYTSNKQLDFSNVDFIVRGTFFESENGKIIVIKKSEISKYQKNKDFLLCPKIFDVKCGSCIACMTSIKRNIAIVYHGSGTKKINKRKDI